MDKYVGLTNEEVKINIEKYGMNVLNKQKKKTFIKILLSQLKDSTIYLLIVAGSLSLLLKEYIDAFIIFFVLVLNSIIGTIQEYNAEKSLEELIQELESIKNDFSAEQLMSKE